MTSEVSRLTDFLFRGEAAAPVARASKHLSLWIDLSVFEKFFWDIQFE